MELRVLNYFLVVAREENITKAAALLHITQPTLSRQLMQLEAELGVTLFRRGRRSIHLTPEGLLLKHRAQELVLLAEKTRQEVARQESALTGQIAIGSGEIHSMHTLSLLMHSFRQKHPLVQFNLYSAASDDIRERLEQGALDLGLLLEPTESGKYDVLRMPHKERWSVLLREDSPLSAQSSLGPEELCTVPLLMPTGTGISKELAAWFGDAGHQPQIAATYNLICNAATMVQHRMGAALCYRLEHCFDGLCFRPLSPPLETSSVLVWKKQRDFSPAASHFIQHAKECLQGIPDHEKQEIL